MNPTEPPIDLKSPELYINRELSLLSFHERVLAMAEDASLPLLERLKFLCISSTNLDEFFEVRVAGLKERLLRGSTHTEQDNLLPAEILKRIGERVHAMVERQYRVLHEQVLGGLAREGIIFRRRREWNARQAKWARRHFLNEVQPLVVPTALDPAHPFPRILNKALNFAVTLEGRDAYGRTTNVAVVKVPRSLPRIIRIPESYGHHPHEFIFLSSIVHEHVGDLFPGMKVTGCYQFRVTRNTTLFVDEEAAEDLLHAMEGEISSRRYGNAVRLEVADNCPEELAEYLLQQFGLTEEDLYRVNGPVNLYRLMALPSLVNAPQLTYPPFSPGMPRRLRKHGDLFETLAHGDLLLHHPFQSFAPVIRLVRQAASDPDVVCIKQTLYRADENSAIIEALVDAARAGKEVTVIVELRARFDEEANIHWAGRLQEAGAQVVYGVVGYKTHAKLCMVIRREGRRLKRYVHLGTGNYHAGTTRLYTDFGLLTCNKEICDDVQKVFQQLTSLGRAERLKHLLQSPFTLLPAVIRNIRRETELAREGREARIIAKVNAISEPEVIQALYEASQAGVKIQLVVRGICCLRPGVAGVSHNIRVRSVVGRFLEHSRIYYFHNGGDAEVYLASADWMTRNLRNRVEIAFPILDDKLARRVVAEGLKSYLADNCEAWELQADGSYRRVMPGKRAPKSAQGALLEKLAE